MTDTVDPKLSSILAELQSRYGDQIIGAAHPADIIRLPTGIAALDEQLDGGLRSRKLTVILGKPTSGATSVVLHAVATSQKNGGHAVYADLAGQFDPDSAALCGVDLSALLIVRPDAPDKAFGIVRDLLANGSSSLVVIDAYGTSLALSPADTRRLQQTLAASSSALVLMAEALPAALNAIAETRIRIDHLAWLRRGTNITGIHSRAIVDDSRSSGRAALLELRFGFSA